MKRNIFESVNYLIRVVLVLVCVGGLDLGGQVRFGFTNEPFKTNSIYDEVENYQIEVVNKLRRYFHGCCGRGGEK